jgi:hypothetical protein
MCFAEDRMATKPNYKKFSISSLLYIPFIFVAEEMLVAIV